MSTAASPAPRAVPQCATAGTRSGRLASQRKPLGGGLRRASPLFPVRAVSALWQPTA